MLCIGCAAANAQTSFTQRLQQSKVGEGKVTISQDKAIDDLVNGPKVTTTPQSNLSNQSSQKTQNTQKNLPQQTQQLQKESKDSATHKTDSTHQQRPEITIPEQPDTTTAAPVDDGRKKIMKGYKVNGFRVQVYAGGNSRDSRIKAERTGKEIKSLFPGTPVYVHFYPPRWICRMGNYRTIEEASEVLRAVKKLGYQSAIIVKGKITVPYQSADQSEAQQQ